MKKNIIIALAVFFSMILWLASGIFKSEEPTEQTTQQNGHRQLSVRVIDSIEEEISEEIVISAKTQPSRVVTVSSELDVSVQEIFAKRGQFVNQGDLLVRLDARDLQFKLQEAKSLLEQRELEYQSAQELFDKRLSSKANVAAAKSALGRAQALVTSLELDIANTQVTAPFEGLLNDRFVEQGDFLKKGNPIAEIVDNDPIVIAGELTEFQVQKARPGMQASAKLIAGKEEVQGTIRYLASKADDQSRTYGVELEVPNPSLSIPAGQSAQITIPSRTLRAHKLNPQYANSRQ